MGVVNMYFKEDNKNILTLEGLKNLPSIEQRSEIKEIWEVADLDTLWDTTDKYWETLDEYDNELYSNNVSEKIMSNQKTGYDKKIGFL
jgi:hypothetical protein